MKKVTLRNRLSYAMVRSIIFVSHCMPDFLVYGLAGMCGRLFFRLSRERRKHAMEFLRLAYPEGKTDAELYRIARSSCANLFKVPVDMVRTIKIIEQGRLADYLDAEEVREHLPGGAFLGVTGHLGSWEMGAIGMASVCGDTHVVVKSFKNPLLHRLIIENRRRAGVHIHRRRGGIRGMARALEEGHLGLQAVDQNQRKRGVFVPFFGKLASTDRSAAVLALRKNIPIMSGRCLRVGGGYRFKIHIDGVIRPEATDDHEADIVRVMTEINRRLEAHIRTAPEQYLWMHNRYRTRPSS